MVTGAASQIDCSEMVEEQLVACGVVPGALVELRGLHAARLNSETLEGCRAAVAAIGDRGSLGEDLRQLAEPLAVSRWTLPGVAFAFYVGLRDRGADLSYLRSVVAELREVARPDVPPLSCGRVGSDDPWVAYFQRSDGLDERVRLVSFDDHASSALNEAFALLREAWPEAADAVDALVRRVVWVENLPESGFRSGVRAQTFGGVFVAVDLDPPRMVEALVHETTHLDLILRLGVDKMIVNRSAEGTSPFRRNPRPLVRVLHAALVAARVCEAYERCARCLEGEQAEWCLAEARVVQGQLAVALETLRSTSEWTTRGSALMVQLEDYSAARQPA